MTISEPTIKESSIFDHLKMLNYQGYVTLNATDVGDNIQECCILFQPLEGPCNFAAYLNVENPSSEDLLRRYSTPVGMQAFIAEFGPLKFVPKLMNELSLDALLDSGEMDHLHLAHQEDFISPYSDEENAALSNTVRTVLKLLENLKAYGATEDVLSFLSNPEFEIAFSSDDDLSFALAPFPNSFLNLLYAPEVTVNDLKLCSAADEVLINLSAVGKPSLLPDNNADYIEVGYNLYAKVDHATKSIKSVKVVDASILVLSYDHDEQNHLMYHLEQWLNDCFTNIQMKDVFDAEVLNKNIKSLCEESPVYHQAIQTKIFN